MEREYKVKRVATETFVCVCVCAFCATPPTHTLRWKREITIRCRTALHPSAAIQGGSEGWSEEGKEEVFYMRILLGRKTSC